MDDIRDFGGLSWIRGEIDKSLGQARAGLETFFEQPAEVDGLRAALAALQQVRGALQMTESSGSAMLAREMEAVAQALVNDAGARRPEAFDALTRAILVLPNYLEWVRTQHQDLPLALLALVNELRALQGATPLAERDLFTPDLSVAPPDWVPPAGADMSGAEPARVRPLYEAGLLEWLRDRAPRHGLTLMAQAAERLKRSCVLPETARLWWLVAAAAEALARGPLVPDVTVKRLLGRADAILKTAAEQGEPAAALAVSEPMLRDLLYIVAQADPATPRLRAVQEAFRLAELFPSAELLEKVRQELTAPATSLFQGVLPALQEDIAAVKDALDMLARQESWQPPDLAPVEERLRRLSDTLQMLGLSEPSEALRVQAEHVASVVSGEKPPQALQLTDVAGTVLGAEAVLAHAARTGAGTSGAAATALEDRDLAAVVIGQARSDMGGVMEAIEEFTLDRGRSDLLPMAVSTLRQIAGALSMLGLTRPTAALRACTRVLEQVLIPQADGSVDPRSLEALADSVAGLAEYLDAAQRGQESRGNSWLDQVDQKLAGLQARQASTEAPTDVAGVAERFPFEPTTAEAPLPEVAPAPRELPAAEETVELLSPKPAAPEAGSQATDEIGPGQAEAPPRTVVLEGVDPEVVEVFLEEARDEVAKIGDQLHRWTSDPDDAESLKTLRRSFHTLKGSGRMVGATTLGEFAWAFENMLNRVIDGTIPTDPSMFALMDEGRGALEQLLTQLQGGPGPRLDVNALADRAHAVSEARGAVVAAQLAAVEQPLLISETEPGASEVATIAPTEARAVFEETAAQEAESVGAAEAVAESVPPSEAQTPPAGLPAVETMPWTEAEDTVAVEVVPFIAPAELAKEPSAESAGGHVEVMEPPTGSVQATWEAPPETPKQAPTLPSGGAVVELDAELAAIFFQEASELLDGNEANLEHWRQEPEQPQWREALQRSLHTLKGSARMAGVSALGDLAHALESLLAAGLERHLPLSGGLFDLLQAGNDRLAQMLDSLHSRTPVMPATDFLERVQWVVEHPAELGAAGPPPAAGLTLAAAPDALPSEPLTEEERGLRSLFLEEGLPLAEAAREALTAWTGAPQDVLSLDRLRDSLRGLKSGAGLARLSAVEGLGGEMLGVTEALASGTLEATPEAMQRLRQAVDLLGDMLRRLRDGSSPTPTGDTIAHLRGLQPAQAAGLGAAAAPRGLGEVLPFPPREEPRPGGRPQYEQVRVRADLLDRLVNLAGEVSIYRLRLEQQVNGFHQALDEFQQTSERLVDQLRRLSIETEAQMLFRHQESAVGQDYTVFEPLELDRYSSVQQLSRSMNESVSDLDNIRLLIDTLARDAELLLVQQGRAHTDLQEGLMHTRMLPFAVLVPRLNRIVRQLCGELGKQAELRVRGGHNELDRAVLDKMVAPLEHILRNAIDHGVEDADVRRTRGKAVRGTIDVLVSRQGTDVVVQVGDDGGGVDLEAVRRKAVASGLVDAAAEIPEEELLQLILESGLSTAVQVSQISGRGVGLDVVDATVKQIGGTVSIRSTKGLGTTFIIRLPLMMSITQALIVQAGTEVYAIPLGQVQAVTQARHEDLARYYRSQSPTVRYAGTSYQFVHLATVLGGPPPELPGPGKKLPLLLMRSGDQQVALQVEAILGRREIVVKPLGPQLSAVRGLLGATILGDGRAALILEGGTVVRRGMAMMRTARGPGEVRERIAEEALTVMVVDDSLTMRKVAARLLERHRMRVLTAADGVEALEQLEEHKPDVMVLDIEMPRMDGYELARHMRHTPELKDIPIVMVTSRIGEKHRRHAIEIGVDRYLGKPYQEADLLENIHAVLRERR